MGKMEVRVVGGYGLTEQEADALIRQGKDFCDYFEHVLLEMGIDGGHNQIGCKWCIGGRSHG
jgi:hypothetical protein